MRLRSTIAVAVAGLLFATPATAQGTTGAAQQQPADAPHAKPIDPVVAPVRRVMPVTPPPSREIKGVDHGAKARQAKGKTSKAGKAARAHPGCGKGRKGKPSCLGAGEVAAAATRSRTPTAAKTQVSPHTGAR